MVEGIDLLMWITANEWKILFYPRPHGENMPSLRITLSLAMKAWVRVWNKFFFFLYFLTWMLQINIHGVDLCRDDYMLSEKDLQSQLSCLNMWEIIYIYIWSLHKCDKQHFCLIVAWYLCRDSCGLLNQREDCGEPKKRRNPYSSGE
jgi:hypothetical protein